MLGTTYGIISGSMLGINASIVWGSRSGICSRILSGMSMRLPTASSMSGMTLGIIEGMSRGNIFGMRGFIHFDAPGTFPHESHYPTHTEWHGIHHLRIELLHDRSHRLWLHQIDHLLEDRPHGEGVRCGINKLHAHCRRHEV